MNKRQILASLNNISNQLDNNGLYKEATALTNVMKKLAQEDLTPEDSKPEYDYTKERLYKEELSDFGKEYVADRNRENPIYLLRNLMLLFIMHFNHLIQG